MALKYAIDEYLFVASCNRFDQRAHSTTNLCRGGTKRVRKVSNSAVNSSIKVISDCGSYGVKLISFEGKLWTGSFQWAVITGENLMLKLYSIV